MVENITVAVSWDGIVEQITFNGVTKLCAHNHKCNSTRWFKNTATALEKARTHINCGN